MQVQRKSNLDLKVVESVLIMLFVFLFAYSSAVKFLDLDDFGQKLLKSPLIGLNYLALVVYAVPFGELLLAILLIFSKSRVCAKYLVFATMSLFTVYLLVLNNIDGFIPCSCGGLFERLSFNQHIIMNIVLSVFSLILIYSKEISHLLSTNRNETH